MMIGSSLHRSDVPAPLRRHRCTPAITPLRRGVPGPSAFRLPFGDLFKQQAPTTRLLQELEELVSGSSYGSGVTAEAADAVELLIDELRGYPKAGARRQAGGPTSSALQLLEGRWELQYTTEGSVHKIVRGLVLGLAVARITQCIERAGPGEDGALGPGEGSGRVTNRIQFSRFGAAIEASAPAKDNGDQRVAYKFDRLVVEALGFRWRLPFAPPGGGWTEAMYCDAEWRLMRNSLGDTLVFRRSRDM